jgi:hypothetical protein
MVALICGEGGSEALEVPDIAAEFDEVRAEIALAERWAWPPSAKPPGSPRSNYPEDENYPGIDPHGPTAAGSLAIISRQISMRGMISGALNRA